MCIDLAQCQQALDRFFRISERGSTIATELRAGWTSFLTLSYILLVHPLILGKAGMVTSDVVTATCLSSGFATLLVALVGNLPFVMAPGLGLSAYFTHGLILAKGSLISWQQALGCVLLAGLAMLFLSVTFLVELAMKHVPNYLKTATIVGIGLLLARLGLESSNLLEAGDLAVDTWQVWLSLGGLMTIAVLKQKNITGGIILGVAATTLTYWIASGEWPEKSVELPSMTGTWAKLSLQGMDLQQGTAGVGTMLLVMLFDCSGCLIALGMHANIISDVSERVPGTSVALIACSLGTVLAGLCGSTPVIIALESTAGILEGGRTGLSSATTGVLLLSSLFFAPLFGSIPELASAGVLILIGTFMAGAVKDISWERIEVALPSFLTMILMPLSLSISHGIGFGAGAALFFALAERANWTRAYFAVVSKGPGAACCGIRVDSQPTTLDPEAPFPRCESETSTGEIVFSSRQTEMASQPGQADAPFKHPAAPAKPPAVVLRTGSAASQASTSTVPLVTHIAHLPPRDRSETACDLTAHVNSVCACG